MHHSRKQKNANRLRRGGALCVLVSLSATLAACGSGSSSSGVADASDTTSAVSTTTGAVATSTTSSKSQADQLVDLARCMRKNGVDMPDPQPDANGNVRPGIPQGVDQTTLRTAFDACRDTVSGIAQPASTADQKDQLVAFAKCMRKSGVPDFPDPADSPSAPGGIFPGYGPNSAASQDQNVQAALKTCRSELGDVGPGGGN